MSNMALLIPVIRRRVFNREPVMPAHIWAMAYSDYDTDITAEKIQAEIDAAREALAETEANAAVDLELLRSRVESEGD